MTKELKFKKPVFHKGVNYTVRLGSKWFDLARPGAVVSIQGKDVLVVTTSYMRYGEIPPAVLEFEHDPECRTFKGLDKAMGEAYPEFIKDPFRMNLYVTIIGFVIK